MSKILISLTLVLFLISCGGGQKKQAIKPLVTNKEAIETYQDALNNLRSGNYLYASRKFSKAEGMLPKIEWASKSALMSSYCLYNLNLYDEAVVNLKRFIKVYPASPHISYAYYLIAISYYEQILDEDKDIQPLIISKKKNRAFY